MRSKSAAFCIILIYSFSLCLVTWDSAAEQTIQEEATVILHDLVDLNVADGNIKRTSLRVNSSSTSFSLLPQEEVDIRFISGLRALVEFVNNTLRKIYLAERDRPSSIPPASQVTDSARVFLGKVQTYTGHPFYGDLRSLLENITGEEDIKKTAGNIELEVQNHDNLIIDYIWTYIDENGTRAPRKNICLSYERGQFKSFLNNWPFYAIATEPKISSEEATGLALKELRSFSYNASEEKSVSKFRIATSGDPVRATIVYSNYPDPILARDGDPLILYPSWSVFMGFDRFYLGYVTGASVVGWADTGEVKSISPTFLYSPDVTPEEIEDDIAPSMTVSSPEGKTYYTSNILLSYNASEPLSWVDYSLDGQANVTITGNTAVTGNLTFSGLSEGSHDLTIYAADAYGSTANIGASETVYFTIAKPEIFSTAIAVTVSGASLAVISIGLLVYLKKRKR